MGKIIGMPGAPRHRSDKITIEPGSHCINMFFATDQGEKSRNHVVCWFKNNEENLFAHTVFEDPTSNELDEIIRGAHREHVIINDPDRQVAILAKHFHFL